MWYIDVWVGHMTAGDCATGTSVLSEGLGSKKYVLKRATLEYSALDERDALTYICTTE